MELDPYANATRTLLTALGLDAERIPLDDGLRIDEDGYLVVVELEQPVRVDGDSLARTKRRLRVTVEEVGA